MDSRGLRVAQRGFAAATVVAAVMAAPAYAVGPDIGAPAPSAFPSTPQGTVSVSRDVTVTNSGDVGPLTITGETFEGNDDFFVAATNCGGPLDPGKTCTISVRFAPHGSGSRSGTMHIYSNASSGSPTDVSLSGTGGDLPQGPQGDTGPQGPIGNTGPQGPIGNTGPQGPIGNTGPQGPIGNTGPQGPIGNTGLQGPIGLRGPAGRDSTVQCKVVKTQVGQQFKVTCVVKFSAAR